MKRITLLVDAVSPDSSAASTIDHNKVEYNLEEIETLFGIKEGERVFLTENHQRAKVGILGRYVYLIVLDPSKEMSFAFFAILKDDDIEVKRFCSNVPQVFHAEIIKAVNTQRADGFVSDCKVDFVISKLE